MTHQDLRDLADFHYWARDRMFDAIAALSAEQFTRDLGNSFPSVRDTVAHMYAAEWVWYQRWKGHMPTALLPADQFPDVPTLRLAWVELEQNVRALLDELGDARVATVMPYTLLSGVSSASPFSHMLQHVVNHGSYHRGQVTTMLRQLGAAPAKSCDLITFYRERASA